MGDCKKYVSLLVSDMNIVVDGFGSVGQTDSH